MNTKIGHREWQIIIDGEVLRQGTRQNSWYGTSSYPCAAVPCYDHCGPHVGSWKLYQNAIYSTKLARPDTARSLTWPLPPIQVGPLFQSSLTLDISLLITIENDSFVLVSLIIQFFLMDLPHSFCEWMKIACVCYVLIFYTWPRSKQEAEVGFTFYSGVDAVKGFI